MSLRFAGTGVTSTAQAGFLFGSTAFSVSFWLKVEDPPERENVSSVFAGSDVFLCQFFTHFSFSIDNQNATGDYQLIARVAGTSTTATFTSRIMDGDRAYHIGLTYGSSEAKLYVNGELVETIAADAAMSNNSRKLLINFFDGTHPGLYTFLIEAPAIWHDVALLGADMLALAEKAETPASMADPAFWHATFDGTLDAEATLADAGLEEIGAATDGDFDTLGSPTPVYAAALELPPGPSPRYAVACPSGKGLAIYLESDAGADADIESIASHPSIAINGGAPVALGTPAPIWGNTSGTRKPYLYYLIPSGTTIEAGDTVTLSADAGWADTSAGAALALTDWPVANNVGGSLWPATGSTSAMAVGTNLVVDAYFSPFPIFNHRSRHLPTGAASSSAVVLGSATVGVGDTKGNANFPDGRYTAKWGGPAASFDLNPPEAGTTWTLFSETLDGGEIEHVREYDIAHDPEVTRAPRINCAITADCENLRFYMPGAATDGSEPINAAFLEQVAWAAVLRTMDFQNTNLSNASTYAEWQQLHTPNVAASIAQIEQDDNADGVFQANHTHLKVTTSAPHGFREGEYVTFTGLPGHVQFAGGTDSAELNNYSLHVHVLTATTFSCHWWTGGTSAAVDTQAITGTATTSRAVEATLADQVTAINASDAGLWLCVPYRMGADDADASLDLAAAYVAENLTAGRTCRVEYGNEPWNSAGPFHTYQYCDHMGPQEAAPLARVEWYAKRAGEVFAAFTAAFTTAGRSADLIRVVGTQHHNAGGELAPVLDYFHANGLTCDEVAIAPYFINHDLGEGQGALYDAADVDQLHDLSEISEVWDDRQGISLVAEHRAVLDDADYAGAFAGVDIVCYEGGPENGQAAWTDAATRDEAGRKSRHWSRHPRMFGYYTGLLAKLRDAGVTLWCDFAFNTGLWHVAGGNFNSTWATYERYAQPAGLNAADADFDALEDLDSVQGFVLSQWAGLGATAYLRSANAPAVAPGGTITITLTPDGDAAGVSITLDPSAGTVAPNPVTFTGPNPAAVVYTAPGTEQSVTIGFSNDGGLADPSDLSVTITSEGPPMAAGFSSTLVNSWLDTDFDDLWIQLHVGDPGAAGTANIAATSTREQYITGAASAGFKTNTAIIRWDTTDAGGETFTHVSIWTASTAGTFKASIALASPVVVAAGQPFEIAAGSLDLAITPLAT